MINGMVFYKPHSGLSYGSIGISGEDWVSMLSAALKGGINLLGEEKVINGRNVYFKQLSLFNESPELNIYKEGDNFYAHLWNGDYINLLSTESVESVTFIKPSWNLETKESFLKECLIEYFVGNDLIFDENIDNLINDYMNNKTMAEGIRDILLKASKVYDELLFENQSLTMSSLNYVAGEELMHSKAIHNLFDEVIMLNDDWSFINKLFQAANSFDINKKGLVDFLSLYVNLERLGPVEAYFFFENGYDLKR